MSLEVKGQEDREEKKHDREDIGYYGLENLMGHFADLRNLCN